MAAKIKNLSGYNDRIMFIILSAPDRFPKVGPFTDDPAKNLSIVFDSLEEGFHLIDKKVKDEAQSQALRKLLKDSLTAYKEGEKKKGAHLLQNFQDVVFPNRFKEYEERKGQ